MEKIKFKLNLVVLLSTIIITLLVGVFSVFYVFNSFDLQKYIQPEIFGYIALVVTVLDCIMCLIFIAVTNKMRDKSDIQISDVIGADVNYK